MKRTKLDEKPNVIEPSGKRKFLVPRFVADALSEIKTMGFRAYLKKKGPWFVGSIILFYFIRDMLLYVVIPYLVVNGIISCPGPEA